MKIFLCPENLNNVKRKTERKEWQIGSIVQFAINDAVQFYMMFHGVDFLKHLQKIRLKMGNACLSPDAVLPTRNESRASEIRRSLSGKLLAALSSIVLSVLARHAFDATGGVWVAHPELRYEGRPLSRADKCAACLVQHRFLVVV